MRTVGFVVLLAACGGGGAQPAQPESAPTTTCFTAGDNVGVAMQAEGERKAELGRAVEEACTSGGWSAEAIACFSGARSGDALPGCDAKLTEPQRTALLDRVTAVYTSRDDDATSEPAASVDLAFYTSTGAPECDELMQRTMCMFRVTPGMPADAFTAFADGIAGWQMALDNESTRQATIDACKMSLDAGKSGFESVGCTAEMTYTGQAMCDELITKTRCMWDKQGAAVSADMRKMFNDAIPGWREALANDATHQATVDACTMAVDAGTDAFAAVGC